MADYEARPATQDSWLTAQVTTGFSFFGLVRLCAVQREGVSGYLLSSPQPRLKQQVMNHTGPLPPPNTAFLDEPCGNYRGGL